MVIAIIAADLQCFADFIYGIVFVDFHVCIVFVLLRSKSMTVLVLWACGLCVVGATQIAYGGFLPGYYDSFEA